MNAIDKASAAQVRAAIPVNSTWVSANAGSGKTRVLTNRVARLLLAGCPPQKILCLTYTKAAAAEMQNRLFSSLGAWAMKPDDALRTELETLGEVDLDADRLRLARTLFARALETPGGLKIQTIHSFCGGILRRFPLEAGVSPQFVEMEDRQAKLLRAEILEEIAIDNVAVFDSIAWHLTGDDTEGLLDGILKLRGGFGTFDADIVAQELGHVSGLTDEGILASVMQGLDDGDIDRLAKAMAAGATTDQKHSVKIYQGMKVGASEALDLYEAVFLKLDGEPRVGSFPTKKVKDANPWVPEILDDLKAKMVIARDQRLARQAFERARALHGFAGEFLGRYDRRKALLGKLDFEDLIEKTRALLGRSNMAAWVLYRLDGGIDHILVDEAQDTSPAQWDIVRILAEEFHAGAEDRETPRTVFVVGDEKQSIYSFQGADPKAFGEMRTLFLDRLAQVAQTLHQTELLYSFRSATPVLAVVDNVFTGDARDGLEGEILHRAVKADLPGRVELWPFVEKPEKPEENPWYMPVDSRTPDDPRLVLAEAVAVRVAGLIKSRHELPGSGRAVSARDFLILVQSRGPLFHAIIKGLKAHGVDVAGADRLKIVEEMAVKDLLALLQFLATPEDDLSLAAALRSPLFGLSERGLYKLAQGRKGTLWQSLWAHREDWPDVVETLDKLQGQADFLRPYDLLEQVLTKYDGRRRLVARLGHEAEDGIDELLTQSLHYESVEAPLLTGFLGWINSDEVEVKRQMDAAGDRVRVMTVHGAKGLEAPIVILPDTTKRAEGLHAPQVVSLHGLPVWRAGKSPKAIAAVEEFRKQLVREEARRLLYVALTRAEQWLIVCGAGTLGKDGENWFQRVEAAMRASGAEATSPPDGLSGEALVLDHRWSNESVDTKAKVAAGKATLPEYMQSPAPLPERADKMVAPSQLGGAHALAGEGDDEQTAMKRGSQIHLLLEVLPDIAKEDHAEAAQRLLDAEDWKDVLAEVQGVLEAPDLADVFAEDVLVEVPVTAEIAELNGARILGRIDRLVISDAEVLAIDFKSNRQIPDTAAETPEAVLRQMGAYRAALAQIYPGRLVKTAIVWTHRAKLMELPEKVTSDALSRAASS
ncbi:double-strand break repair helicase AddA [Rhodobacterales bacterium 52_120_T64]|nr:double-strand break repair helicase AddA [Rhodobacterales bacterium 52_120_T64]